MAGLYLHIPYCKQACHYCDFHFSTNVRTKNQVLKAIKKEISIKSGLFTDLTVQSVYFGGGTPSILIPDEVSSLLSAIKEYFILTKEPEITLECNPDDIHSEYLQKISEVGINRLSLGVQSFNNDFLTFMNRAHSAGEAIKSLDQIKKSAISNINTDLIFAIPGETLDLLDADLNTLLEYRPSHISTYCLTIEPQTVFAKWQHTGKFSELEDEEALEQYLYICKRLRKAGYEHYEVSNFALPGKESRHNSSYWQGAEYIGLGPGAHSFYNNTRYSNITNNTRYYQALLDQEIIPEEKEILSTTERFNEYLMIKLRTSEGLQLEEVNSRFGVDLATHYSDDLKRFEDSGLIKIIGQNIVLTDKGLFLSDEILMKLFLNSHSL